MVKNNIIEIRKWSYINVLIINNIKINTKKMLWNIINKSSYNNF